MKSNVCWMLELSIKSGKLNDFKTLMGEMVNSTKTSEPSTLNYEWYISNDNKTCHIYERYLDSNAVMIHLGTFGQKFAERFLAVVEPTRFIVYGNPSKDVTEALSGFGPVYMAQIDGFAR